MLPYSIYLFKFVLLYMLSYIFPSLLQTYFNNQSKILVIAIEKKILSVNRKYYTKKYLLY